MVVRFQKQIGITLTVFLIVTSVFSDVSANRLVPNSSTSLVVENQGCSNLDVVFIVDQSWAMSAPGTSEAVDPLNQRKFSVDAMIDLLTGLALDQCPGTHHRISVISYGSLVRTNLNMYSINPKTAEDANELRDENGIKKSVVADNLGSDNNPEAAFVEAAKLWRNATDVDEDNGNRKKVIIFLTNGISKNSSDYVKSTELVKKRVNGLFPFDENLLKLETCLSDLRKQSSDGFVPPEDASTCMVSYPVDQEAYDNSTYIWTVFLKPPGYENYGQAYESMISHYDEMSKAHGGEAIELKARSRKDVPSTFRNILSYLAGVRPVLLNCGEFAMNSYLREARLTVYKIDPEIKITLGYKDQAGVQHSLLEGQSNSPEAFNVKDYYAFGANEAYILSYPYGGVWQLTADNCQGLDTYYEQVDIDTSRVLSIPDVIPQYEVEPYYDPEHPQYLIYEMFDNTGTLIPQAENPRFTVDVNATVTSQSEVKKNYVLKWDAATKTFRSQEPLDVSSSGSYNVHISGTTYRHEGNPSPLETANPELVFDQPFSLFDINTQFEVLPVIPFTIDVAYPPRGETIKNVHKLTFDRWPPLDIAPLPIRVRLLDRDGNMIAKPEDYLASTQGAFTAHVKGGGQVSETIILQPDANEPEYFTGEIPDFAVVGGEQKIVVVMDNAAMLTDKRPYNRNIESDFIRLDDLFRTPVFWQFLLIAAIIYMIVTIIVYFAVRSNKVSGTLILEDGPAIIAEFNLASGKNSCKIESRQLKNYPQLGLKKIKVINISRKRMPKVDGDFVGTSFGGDSRLGVRVFCAAEDGRRFEIDLDPDHAINYDSATSFTMIYKPL